MEEKKYFSAYYYGFEATGVPSIDAILEAVAMAGKWSHSTETWQEPMYDGLSPQEAIQEAANNAAKLLSPLK